MRRTWDQKRKKKKVFLKGAPQLHFTDVFNFKNQYTCDELYYIHYTVYEIKKNMKF